MGGVYARLITPCHPAPASLSLDRFALSEDSKPPPSIALSRYPGIVDRTRSRYVSRQLGAYAR